EPSRAEERDQPKRRRVRREKQGVRSRSKQCRRGALDAGAPRLVGARAAATRRTENQILGDLSASAANLALAATASRASVAEVDRVDAPGVPGRFLLRELHALHDLA